MPVNFGSETKNGVEKPRFSLSLNKNNATYLINGNSKENNSELQLTNRENKENKPVKRPFTSTYLNTLHAAKKLKPLSQTPKPTGILIEPGLLPSKAQAHQPSSLLSTTLARVAMLNGHHNSDSQNGSASRKTPIGTLSNLGNTCFLNSVLYTLRYAPRFVHNLHHLVSDLAGVEQRLGSVRLKSSSLGRGAASLAAAGARSWSSKDLLALPHTDTAKTKIQIATEKLHETYLSLRAAENKCSASAAADAAPEPYAADAFLAALREVNSTFEGNRQQDAHELLVCILDNIRETCRALSAKAARLQLHETNDTNGINRQPSLEDERGKTLGNLRKSWKKRKEGKERRPSPPAAPPDRAPPPHARPGWDFVAEHFEGTMVVRTMCVECEAVRETAQAVCELCVPVGEEPPPSDQPFRAACLSTEQLRDQNKYWCEQCLRYNEARRSVGYSRLPRLLVLQLKRFSGGMEKITRHQPTPLLMPCFCSACADAEPPALRHRYVLWAVIMHLGQSLTGGHYVAYVRAGAEDGMADGEDGECERDGTNDAAPAHTTSSFMRTLFNRPRPQPSGCMARECCVPFRGAGGSSAGGWLQCDDELVKPLSNEEFEDLLSPEPKLRSAATPYLLFYVKTDVG